MADDISWEMSEDSLDFDEVSNHGNAKRGDAQFPMGVTDTEEVWVIESNSSARLTAVNVIDLAGRGSPEGISGTSTCHGQQDMVKSLCDKLLAGDGGLPKHWQPSPSSRYNERWLICSLVRRCQERL